MIKFTLDVKNDAVILRPEKTSLGILRRWKRDLDIDLTALPKAERELAYALARVHSLDPEAKDSVIRRDSITLSHRLVSRLDKPFANTLGLPALVHDLVFCAKLQGDLGSEDAEFKWWWENNGRREAVARNGSILHPDLPEYSMRLPEAIFEAITLSDTFDPTAPLEKHWQTLARFKTLLGDDAENVALDQFLNDLRIVTISRVGIEVNSERDDEFAPVPFSTNENNAQGVDWPALFGSQLESFQDAVTRRGAQPAYRLSDGTFTVVDRSAAPVLRVIAEAMQGDANERRYFIENAPRIIAEAIEEQLRETGRLNEETSPEGVVELIEQTVGNGWTETNSWSDRVTGIGVVPPTPSEINAGTGLPWLPATMNVSIGEVLGAILDEDVANALQAVRTAIIDGVDFVSLDVGDIPANGQVAEALERRLAMLPERQAEPPLEAVDAFLPLTHDNFWDVEYVAGATPRRVDIETKLPSSVKTPLRYYQSQSFQWQLKAWASGLPGLLNADEQGLGKTLQTLSFLAWLNIQMEAKEVAPKPTLIVAPTSLLRNWEAEIETHLSNGALGPIYKFYGPELSRWKIKSIKGRDIGDGREHLDLEFLRGARGTVITTYQTLANYAVSLAQLPFSVAVFDEMQFVKNPRTQRSRAAKAMNAEFTIGLTGTPIENATRDIWAIMDVICPGALGALSGFRRLFDRPSHARLAQLRNALFDSKGDRPPLCMRRTKAEADPSIPPKTRLLYPREMPETQAIRYDEARAKTGGILQVLQHIRRASAHPGLIEGELGSDFAAASARTKAVLDILALIKSRNERVLIFIENRDIQAWFIEVLKIEFDLPEVMLINGDTPIDDRKDITDRFQRHLSNDEGFDVLVLGPRAAGTGLTLTAANHVIHLTRWWNPAVEEQCNDRTHRIGQQRPVTVHLPLAVHPKLGRASFDCLLHRLMTDKLELASNVLQPADINEDDIKGLHHAAVSGRIVDDMPREKDFVEFFVGREDLIIERQAENVFVVQSNQDGASVLIAAEQSKEELHQYLDDKLSEVILLKPTEQATNWESVVPLCNVTDVDLWPDFVLPA